MAIKPTFSNKIKDDLRRDFSFSRATSRSKLWFFLNIGLAVAIVIVWVLLALPSKKAAVVTAQSAAPAQTQQSTPTTSTTAPATSGKTYTVQTGDSLYDIGTKTGVDWNDIATYNGIQPPYNLTVGQKLKLSAQ